MRWVLQEYRTIFGWPDGRQPVPSREPPGKVSLANLLNIVTYLMSAVTIILCVFMKVPQIMYLRERQSTDGINISAILMEIAAFTIVSLYNFTHGYSLMTYPEYPILLLQVAVMLYYALAYKDLLPNPIVPLGAMAYVLAVIGFASGVIPKDYLNFMFPLCPILSGFAKISYIYGIIKAENAETVSLTTWIISILVNISRIYTVYSDSGDTKLMTNLSISAVLSCAVLFTAFYYQKKLNISSSDLSPHQKTQIVQLLRILNIDPTRSK